MDGDEQRPEQEARPDRDGDAREDQQEPIDEDEAMGECRSKKVLPLLKLNACY